MCNLSKGVEEKGIEKGILLSIRNLMETMGWSVEQAMEGLKIPEEEKRKYFTIIKKCKGTKYINFEIMGSEYLKSHSPYIPLFRCNIVQIKMNFYCL